VAWCSKEPSTAISVGKLLPSAPVRVNSMAIETGLLATFPSHFLVVAPKRRTRLLLSGPLVVLSFSFQAIQLPSLVS
jgi:hypothetical protein